MTCAVVDELYLYNITKYCGRVC